MNVILQKAAEEKKRQEDLLRQELAEKGGFSTLRYIFLFLNYKRSYELLKILKLHNGRDAQERVRLFADPVIS